MSKLATSAESALARGDNSNANVKLFDQISKNIYEIIPSDPASDQFRQGNTLGKNNSAWRRSKFGGRFRLFFRYHSSSKLIAFAWVNDSKTLRKAGSKTDPYTIFEKMLASGKPPGSFKDLVKQCTRDWK